MPFLGKFRALTRVQRNTFSACFLGWTLDAFDFFLLTFCLTAIAVTFHTGRKQAEEAIFWTLAMRPVGAFLFGSMAEKYGRRPTLIVNVIAFSAFELASALAPTLSSFLVCRALFGVAMGGVWGVGAALVLETLPAEGRGFFSGLLQEGYVCGNLLAALLFASLWAASGVSARRWPWKPCLRKAADSSPACYRKATSAAICWLRCCLHRSSPISMAPASSPTGESRVAVCG